MKNILLEQIKRMFRHELINGATIIFLGSLLTNVVNFFFNLFMVRNLSEGEYGILASLLSFISLSTLPAGAAVPTLVHFGASYFAKNELNLVKGLFFKATKFMFVFGIVVFLTAIVFAGQIKEFFRIEDEIFIILAAISMLFGIMQVVNFALLQAKLAFSFITLVNLLGSISKLLFGVILIFLHFAAKGGLSAYLLSAVIPYAISFIPLRFVFQSGIIKSKLSLGTLISYGAPSAIALFGLTSFISTDIILVKHFFNPVDAGVYATLSLVGKVIFYFSAPITTVMFPLIAQKYTRSENFHRIFKLSLLLVFAPSLVLSIFYFFLPEFIVGFFTNKSSVISAAGSYLWMFGIFIALYSAIYVFVNFFLAIKKTDVFVPVVLCAGLQVVGISVFHRSFMDVLLTSIIVTSLLLFLLLLYYWKLYGTKSKI